MAAAHLRLSIGLAAANVPAARRAEYEQAAGLRAQLGEQDQRLMEAMQPSLQNAKQDTAETDRRLRALAQRYPGDEQLWMLLGIIHYATAAGLDPAEHALALDPGDAQAVESKGLAYLARGQYAEAQAAFAQCGSLSVDGADCFGWLGITDSLRGQCAEYERHEQSATDRSPIWMIYLVAAKADNGAAAAVLEEMVPQVVAGWPAAAAPEVFGVGVKVRLAIIAGDFTRAAALAKQEAAMIMADPALQATYSKRYLLAGHLFEIALETGDDLAMRRIANDFVAHRDAWATEATIGHSADLSLSWERLVLPAREPLPEAFEAGRRAWIERATFAGADPAQIWDCAYASLALTENDARAALDALGKLGPPSPTPAFVFDGSGRTGSPEANLGRVYLLVGRPDEAVEHLKRAVANCDLYTSTLDHVHAELDLGKALEQKHDTAGACDAYGKVLARWGHARPRSVTADEARARSKAIGCAPQEEKH